MSVNCYTLDDLAKLFKDDKWRDYLCVKCVWLPRNAVQTRCGHWMCKECANDLFHVEFTQNIIATCPKKGCSEKLKGSDGTEYFADNFVRRVIRELPVCCPIPNCEWTGEYHEYDEHTRVKHMEYKVKPEKRKMAEHGLVKYGHVKKVCASHKDLQKLSKEIEHDEERLQEKEKQITKEAKSDEEKLLEKKKRLLKEVEREEEKLKEKRKKESKEVEIEKEKLSEKKKRFKHHSEELSKSIERLEDNVDPVRAQVSERVESAAQSTASLGRAGEQTPNEKSSTLNADRSEDTQMPHLEIKPVSEFPKSIPVTTPASKTVMVTGTKLGTSSKEESKSKKKKSGKNQPVANLPPPEQLAHNTSLLPPISCPEQSPSPPRSPTSAAAAGPPSHRRRPSLPEISTQPKSSTGRTQALSAHPDSRHTQVTRLPLATINGVDESRKKKACEKCKSILHKFKSALSHVHGSQCDDCSKDFSELELLVTHMAED